MTLLWVVSSHECGEFAPVLEYDSLNGANRCYGGDVIVEEIATDTLPGPIYGATTVAVLGREVGCCPPRVGEADDVRGYFATRSHTAVRRVLVRVEARRKQ